MLHCFDGPDDGCGQVSQFIIIIIIIIVVKYCVKIPFGPHG